MLISAVEVRFFRSFNYDYEAKFKGQREQRTWEQTPIGWYPYIRVPIESDLTAIVGANESGKSQLLKVVKTAIGHEPISRSDFCRYSELYSVQTNEVRSPEFGITFKAEASDDPLDIESIGKAREFTLYRPGTDRVFVALRDERIELSDAEMATLEARLPTILELKTNLAIPDDVSYAELLGEVRQPIHDRKQRGSVLEMLSSLQDGIAPDPTVTAIVTALSGKLDDDSPERRKRAAEASLARQLLVDGAKIDPNSFADLRSAMRVGNEGEIASLIGAMNRAIRENLNFQRWWSQDQDFDLLVEARDDELAFLIQDRTKARYSFDERSMGLRFFLSYFVQLRAHSLQGRKPDVLLLDEPDAYLSSIGQADLMRVLQNYATPEDGSRRSQVIYVTHSPFLVDKNAPHRIRVLDKGSETEGTRVVRDAANNRYEPLRSSLGESIAETAFIGGKNLFVEGRVDQILLVGLSAHLAKRSGSTAGVLNLNDVTVVAADGADAVPYMVYLARGRDSIKPPCVALLDGDKSGQEAERLLRRGEARKRRILADRFILRLDTWGSSDGIAVDDGVLLLEIEDLVPVVLAHRAALNYFARFGQLTETDLASFTAASIAVNITNHEGHLWDSIDASYRTAFPDDHIEKAGWAREIVSLLSQDPDVPGADLLRERFGKLLSRLDHLLDDAAVEEYAGRKDDRLRRIVKNFELNYSDAISKHDAGRLLRQMDSALGESRFRDSLTPKIEQIGREFELDDLSSIQVPRFVDFRAKVLAFGQSERLAYQDDAELDPAAAFLPDTRPKREQASSPARKQASPRKRARKPNQ